MQAKASKKKKGIPKPGKGTSAEEWVPRGNTVPKGKPDGGVLAGDSSGVSGMEVEREEKEENVAQVEEEEGRKAENETAPPALLAVMTHRNACKLLLRLLAPEHTG